MTPTDMPIFPMRMFDRNTGKARVFFGQDEYDRDKDAYAMERPPVEAKKADNGPRLQQRA